MSTLSPSGPSVNPADVGPLHGRRWWPLSHVGWSRRLYHAFESYKRDWLFLLSIGLPPCMCARTECRVVRSLFRTGQAIARGAR